VGLDVTANCNLVDLELLLQCKDYGLIIKSTQGQTKNTFLLRASWPYLMRSILSLQ